MVWSPYRSASGPIRMPISRYQPREGERKRGRRKTWSWLLFPRAIRRPQAISSLAGDLFSPSEEKKHLPSWGEGTR
ncbi:hypothetical protein BHE74_00056756 [Ensete ventricosum]|nr:hypothetical protein BHE74_00056756 [Ensete ventricosum]